MQIDELYAQIDIREAEQDDLGWLDRSEESLVEADLLASAQAQI
jgi:hypothetical protein